MRTCQANVELHVIYELCPELALFKPPALAHKDVQTWMKTTFQTELVALQVAAGSSIDLALEETRSLLQDHKVQMEKKMQMIQ